jgi:indole-3-glycerol phosphate synthase
MHHRLVEILDEKKNEVARLKKSMPFNRDKERQPLRDFKAAISIPQKISLIAEIKFASPSAGLIRAKVDPISIGRDQRFFQGDLEHLPHLKKAISLPILRKDFIIDAVQVREAFFYGADAVLLIARILSQQQLAEYIDLCRELGMAPLTEVHSRVDLEKAVACGAGIIGINNRDLDSFNVDIHTTFKLAPLVPKNCILISESGITQKGDMRALQTTGIQAVLVGSALMGSEDPAKKTKEIVIAGER